MAALALTMRICCLVCSHWLHRTGSCSTISAAVVARRAISIRRRSALIVSSQIDSLHLGKVTLLGHSWGGLVAMRYAARHPERLHALISHEHGRARASLRGGVGNVIAQEADV
jgi:pimeloyl-ACP methyl ester carboxylesterase